MVQFGLFSFALQEVRAAAVFAAVAVATLLVFRRSRSVGILVLAVGLWGCREVANFPPLSPGLRCEGQTVVVGVSPGGIGFHTAEKLVALGCSMIVAGRNTTSVANELSLRHPSARIIPMTVDLSNLDSVKRFSSLLSSSVPSIDLLVLNAGVMGSSTLTDDGFEQTAQVNHLAPFFLTKLLLPVLKKSQKKPRVVVVASAGSLVPKFTSNWTQAFFSLPGDENLIGQFVRYTQSKLANVLFAKGRVANMLICFKKIFLKLFFPSGLADRNAWLTVYSLHPGFIDSLLYRSLLPYPVSILLRWFGPIFAKSLTSGAHVTITAATVPELEAASGSFFSSSGSVFNYPEALNISSAAADELWDASEAVLERQIKSA